MDRAWAPGVRFVDRGWGTRGPVLMSGPAQFPRVVPRWRLSLPTRYAESGEKYIVKSPSWHMAKDWRSGGRRVVLCARDIPTAAFPLCFQRGTESNIRESCLTVRQGKRLAIMDG